MIRALGTSSRTSGNEAPDHLDIMVMQPDCESDVLRDVISGVLAFNSVGRGEALHISFPLYGDDKVTTRGTLGPLVRITGPTEKLYVLTLRYEVAGHLRAGRATTLRRERQVVVAGSHERFRLLEEDRRTREPGTHARPLVLSGQPRVLGAAGRLGVAVRDEALFVARDALHGASHGEIDLLGFSATRTLPVLR